MIYKAIISEIINNGYEVRIRIPVLHKIEGVSNATKFNDLPIATVCTQPGIKPAYKVGDIVFVSFENDDTYYPLVLGQLYCEKNTSQSNIDTLSLNVESHATLPISSIMGDVEYDDISQLKELKGSIQSQITQLTEKFNDLTNRIEQLENKG